MEIDGRLQVTAGAALLHRSRLVEWNRETIVFTPVPRETFEYSWQMDVDPAFGRLMCWILFSAGAEFWLKGLCLLHGIEIRDSDDVSQYPVGDIDEWALAYNHDWRSRGVMTVRTFGTLGDLMRQAPGAPSALDRLLCSAGSSPAERALIKAAYRLLQKSIRNRDAHAYVPNVRDSHYHLVPELFARCLNITAAWIPGGEDKLNDWMRDAKEFIRKLD